MKKSFYLIMCLFSLVGCKHYPEDIEPCQIPDEVKYYKDVKPIIQQNCATSGCHNSTSGLGNFNNYDELNTVCNNGQFQKRVLFKQDMPPFKLDTCDFLKLKKWYYQGHKK